MSTWLAVLLLLLLPAETLASETSCQAAEALSPGRVAELEAEVAGLRAELRDCQGQGQAPALQVDGSAACCFVPETELLGCLAAQATPEGSGRIMIVTAASPEVATYGRFAAAVNNAWARRFGHELVVDTGALPSDGRKPHSGIIGALRRAMLAASDDVGWFLRLDCDAVLSNFEEDLISKMISQHPEAEILISRAEGQSVQLPSLFNFGVVLFRKGPYTLRLIEEMWNHEFLTRGVDQDLFTLMYQANWENLQQFTVGLQPTEMNSDGVAITGRPAAQPIYHLWGHPDDVRVSVFREAFRQTCAGKLSLELNGTYLSALETSARGSLGETQAATISGYVGDSLRNDAVQAIRAWKLAGALDYWGNRAGAEFWWGEGLKGAELWPDCPDKDRYTMWDHLQALYASASLAISINQLGRQADAHELAARTVDLCNRASQPKFLRLREECSEYQRIWARTLLESLRAAEAEPHWRAALGNLEDLRANWNRQDDLESARAADGLALAVLHSNSGEATELLQQAVVVFKEHLPATSVELALAQAKLATLLGSAQRSEEQQSQ
ncbi:unnamed protein product, partial [Polarella glacialis]